MISTNIYRTHSCGELNIKNINQHITLSGWINSIRNLGGITFVTLRDNYGITQLVVDNEKFTIPCKESVITIEGTCVERSSKNLKMPTGEIEIIVDKLNILSESKNVLPFEINENNAKEDLRLKYRYLDLRNSNLHNNIIVRSNLLQFVRDFMHKSGFIEIQTPILTSSSPEGARDFLVPSRINEGKFYALPQSPQIFKQLLMVSGFDKYFQIAPCFRDEDARADRTPGEFYQMDMEMSFATLDDVFDVIERLMTKIMAEFTDKNYCLPPYKRIKFKESMEKYCTDKPDLRNPLIVVDATDVFKNTSFNAFKDKTIKCICAPTGEKSRKFYDELTTYVINNEGKGLCWFKVADNQLVGSAVKFLSEKEILDLQKLTNFKNGDSLFLIADIKNLATKMAGIFRNKLGAELNLIDENKMEFCWIVDFPFFEYDEENDCIAFSHNPFSMPQGGMDALTTKNPYDIVAYQADLVLNGTELLSGAVRNHDTNLMVKAFEMAGYTKDVVENKFPSLYNAFQYGAPPHAGCAIGFDRLLMYLVQTDIIRDVIAFPFNKNAQDLLMGAPNDVSQKQLDDVHIKLNIKENKK